MHIRVKGIAYPVATHRVVDLKANQATRRAIRAELPYLRVEIEPERMSATSATKPPRPFAPCSTGLRA